MARKLARDMLKDMRKRMKQKNLKPADMPKDVAESHLIVLQEATLEWWVERNEKRQTKPGD